MCGRSLFVFSFAFFFPVLKSKGQTRDCVFLLLFTDYQLIKHDRIIDTTVDLWINYTKYHYKMLFVVAGRRQEEQAASSRRRLPSTDDSDKTRSQWYKEMYCQIHKPPEHRKDDLDVILVKLPLTHSRYRDYRQRRDGPANPYKPTYTFPDEYDGDLERMEDYIRKSAVPKLNNGSRNFSSSPVRTPTATVNDYPANGKRNPEKITRFSDQLTTSNTSPTIERAKPINVTIASPVTVNSRSNTTHATQPPPLSSSSTDDEQKSIYKRVLRGGDIPPVGLQKRLPKNRGKHMVVVFYRNVNKNLGTSCN
ncbi:unnamed protein product [Adineta ricciae]|uniref:Uncharacterized protein n=1 Tax=Adineta ricciae TaxID=249248 RepID=A0A814XTG1_ADIRI|nr:unnamed protein product [Adineta ricciae]